MICHVRCIAYFVFTGIVIAFLTQDVFSESPNSPLKIQRINAPITLDGISDEPAWMGIESLPMKMRWPYDYFGSEPSERTEILLGYDDDYLYAAGRFYAVDASQIQAASFERDVWTYNSDFMMILLDTFHDHENAVLFATTPVGTRTDVNFLNDADGAPNKNMNKSWNTFWDVTTVRNDHGWFAEMRIPFSSLRFEQSEGRTVMGLVAHRWIPIKNESYTFPLIPEKFEMWGTYMPSQAQEILFEDIKIHHPLYITPYFLGGLGQSYQLADAGTLYTKSEKYAREAGLDLKYGLTNNLTLDVTFNTDFAQVEADNQQINLTRYSLFFPEKRMFFMEREGTFDFGFEGSDRLFYSRRIGIHNGKQVRIYGGARVVGRVGPWDIGFLDMQTEQFEDLSSENFGVLRLSRRVINPNSYFGGMITSRGGEGGTWNTAYGIDGKFNIFGDDYFIIKWAQTFDDEQENDPISLKLSKIYVNWDRRTGEGFGYNLSYTRSGEAFNPGMGYERRNDYTRLGNLLQYGWSPDKKSQLNTHHVFVEGSAFIRNIDGTIETSEVGPGWKFEANNNSVGSISFKQYREDVAKSFSLSEDAVVPAGTYTFYGVEGEYSTPRGNSYNMSINIDAGSFYDGRRVTVSLNPTANFSAHLQLSGRYEFNKITFPSRDQVFTGHIGRLKVSAFLNVRLFLMANIQYNSADDRIITNFRFRYNPREGNDFYIVYDEDLNTDREREIPILPRVSSRTILLKYSYMFNL